MRTLLILLALSTGVSSCRRTESATTLRMPSFGTSS